MQVADENLPVSSAPEARVRAGSFDAASLQLGSRDVRRQHALLNEMLDLGYPAIAPRARERHWGRGPVRQGDERGVIASEGRLLAIVAASGRAKLLKRFRGCQISWRRAKFLRRALDARQTLAPGQRRGTR